MLNITDKNLMINYAQQFGRIYGKGSKYLSSIIQGYVNNGCTANRNDYSRFIKETAAEFNITPSAVRSAIKNYIKNGWGTSESFAWEWKNYTGWDEITCPTTSTAIRLVCQSYVPFMTKYEDIIRSQRCYYLQAAIQDYENSNPPKTNQLCN